MLVCVFVYVCLCSWMCVSKPPQEQSAEGPPPLTPPAEVKEVTLGTPSVPDELDTPTSIASAMTSTNESSTETDTPQQTDTEVRELKCPP